MELEELRARVRELVRATTGARTDNELPVGLTTAQAAKVLNRSKKTLRNWSSSGEGPIRPNKDANGILIWPIRQIEDMLAGGA